MPGVSDIIFRILQVCLLAYWHISKVMQQTRGSRSAMVSETDFESFQPGTHWLYPVLVDPHDDSGFIYNVLTHLRTTSQLL